MAQHQQPNRAQLTDGILVRLVGGDWTITEIVRTIGGDADRVLVELIADPSGDAVALRGTPQVLLSVVDKLPVRPEDRMSVRRRFEHVLIDARRAASAAASD